MRFIAGFLTLLSIAAVPHTGFAAGLPTDVLISTTAAMARTTGQVLGGDTQSYRVRLTAPQLVTFNIDASSTDCKADVKKTSQLGVLVALARFPAAYSDAGKSGEDYTISFYQSRTAWSDKLPCSFAFSVK